MVDGQVLGDGSTLDLGEATVGFGPSTRTFLLSNPTSATIGLPGDSDTWLNGDARVSWSVSPPAELAPGATATVALSLSPDDEGPVEAVLTLPTVEPITLWLVADVHGPLPTVVVGRLGRKLLSHDYGLTWSDSQEVTDPGADEWRDDSNLQDVTYGNGRFVAVGGSTSERIAWSDDGVVWHDVGDPDTGSLATVSFGRLADGTPRFVATRGHDLVWSPDGESWIREAGSAWQGLSSMAFGGDRWVGVGRFQGVTFDGQTWASDVPDESLSQVVYGEGLFVAVGSGGRVAHSVDGIDWTEQVLASDTNFGGVAYGNGRFVTGGWPGGQFVSEDGMTWTSEASNELLAPLGYANGRFVGATWRDRVWYSVDGTDWVMSQDNSSPEWAGFTSMAAATPE